MSLKDKITSLLFSPKPQLEEEEEFDTVQASVTEEVTQTQTNGILDQALLELPSEHPIHRLYDQRRKQSGYLPSPRICLDEDGVLPPELLQREKNRIQTILKGMCNARLKEAKGGKNKGGGKAKADPKGKGKGDNKKKKKEPSRSWSRQESGLRRKTRAGKCLLRRGILRTLYRSGRRYRCSV